MKTLPDLEAMELADPVVDEGDPKRDEWLKARSGNITCSKFGALMGSPRGGADWTGTALTYLAQIIAERLGSCVPEFGSASTSWGIDNEPHAVLCYEASRGVKVDHDPHRYFASDIEGVGGSPDGLVGDDGCVEIKCPHNPANHVRTILGGGVPSEYVWQVHGHMLVTGRQWCDFVSFDPRIPSEDTRRMWVVRTERDERAMQKLRDRLEMAVQYVDDSMRLTAKVA